MRAPPEPLPFRIRFPEMKTRRIFLLFAMASALIADVSADPIVSGDYHVNPVSGSDSNPGTALLPFRTIARAGQAAQAGDVVLLRGGTYRETFAPANSGQAGNPIIFAGFPNEDVIISGYDLVTGWTSEGNGIYQATVASPAKFHVLINGESAIEARWPNHNSWEILESPRGTVTSASNSGAVPAGHDTITDTALPGGLPATWLDGARVHYKDWYRDWSFGTKTVTAFNPTTKSITMDSMILYSDAGQFMSSTSFRYELQGSRGLIDVDNEWAYDATTGKLHLKSPGGVHPSTLVIESPARDITVNLSGRSHLRLENVRIIGGSIRSDGNTTGCVVNGVTQRYATRVNLLTGTGNEISDSEFTDSLQGSVEVTGTRQRFVNNRLHEISGRSRTAYLRGNEHLVAYNTFARSYDSFINLSTTSRCRIVHNNFSEGPLRNTDTGMIYTVFNGGMTEIAYNRLMSDYRKFTHTYGIYLDRGASHYLVHHNVSFNNMFNTLKNGLLVFNNTTFRWADYGDGPTDPLKRQSERQGTSTDFAGCLYLNNLYGYTYDPIPGQPEGFYLDKVHANTAAVFNDTSGLSLATLEEPQNYDFTLKPGSPAIDAGTPIEGITDGFTGAAPDLGAFESGKPAWKSGHDFINKPSITYEWPDDLRISRYTNLLRNGSFDDPLSNSTLYPWTVESGHVSRYQSPGWDWAPEDLAYTPYGSMRLGRGSCGASQQVMNVPGGRSYAFTLWVRPTAANQAFEMGVRLPDDSFVSTTGTNFVVGTERWTRMFVGFTLPSGNHSVTAFVRKTSADDSFAYVDEAILSESFNDVVQFPATPGATPFVASEDTYTLTGTTTDFSGENTLILREGGSSTRRPYFKFDLSAHAGRTVQQALLRLYGSGDDRLWNIAVREISNNWSTTGPDPITAANAPALGATLATFQAQGSTRGWLPLYVTADLTGHINARLAAGGLVSLSLDDLNNSGQSFEITSSEVTAQTPPHAVSSPQLDILFAPPPVPGAFSVSGSVAAPHMQLSWTPSPDALSYEIRRATSAGGPFQPVATVTGASWQDSTAVTGTAYFYTVTGINETGAGPTSAAVSGTVPPISEIVTTTGVSFDMSLGSTWDDFLGNDIIPNNTPADLFVPVFDVAGTYIAPAASNFHWHGLRSDAPGTFEINPGSGGNAYTIHLGIGGISGTQNIDRLGTGLTLNVGTNHQTWSVELSNIQAAISGSATITYNHPSRMWLRGANFGFNGIWRADGGVIHPDANANWSGSTGATGQLLNNGALRLSNSVYDRIRLELNGNGRLITSGNSTDNGALSTFTTGSGTGDITGSGDLTVTSNASYGKILINGTSSNSTADLLHDGDIIIDNKSAGMTLELGQHSTATFTIGENGANSQIRGLDPTNSKLIANGGFILNRDAAALADGNSWTLIDVATLTESFGANFSIVGFTESTPGLWTLVEGLHTWTFTESTGVLTLEIPSPTLTQITTTGVTTDLSLGSTWDDINGIDIVPNGTPLVDYIPVFDAPGIYTAPASSVFTWKGMQFATGGVELNPGTGGSAFTLNLGSSGISGTSSPVRLGSNLAIDVGDRNQTWTSASNSIWNIQAAISGTANVTLGANANYWFRGNNSNFTGTWILTNGTFQTTDSNSLGSSGAAIELANNTTLRLSTGSYDAECTLTGASANLLGNNGATVDFTGAIDGGSLGAPATLNFNVNSGALATFITLHGDLNRHVGPMVISRTNTSAAFSVHFSSTSFLSAKPEAAGVLDGVNTLTTPLLRAGSGTGSVNVLLDGTLSLDLSTADSTPGNTWRIIGDSGLAILYGPNFSVQGFTAEADGLTWTLTDSGRRWTFSEVNGTLSVAEAPPPIPPDDVFFMGGQSNAKIDVAAGIADTLRVSGQFNNPRVVTIRHSGQPISRWFSSGTPREFYDQDFFGLTGTYDQDGLPQGLLQTALASPGGPHAFRGFFWWQGEADANLSAAYSANFLGLLDRLVADTGQTRGTGPNQWTFHLALPDDVARSYEAIRAVQIDFANQNASAGTYFDTRPYPRLNGDTNPHPSEEIDYFIGVELARQLLALRGLPPVDLSAPANATLVKTDADVLSTDGRRKLNRHAAWTPAGVPGPTNILRFDNSISSARSLDPAGSPTAGDLVVHGLQHAATQQITIDRYAFAANTVLSLGAAGLDASQATARLVLNSDIKTHAPQTWTVATGQSLLFNQAASTYDLRQANLGGGGTYDLRFGTFHLGTQANPTGLLDLSIGGPVIHFALAAPAGQASALGTQAVFRTASGGNATFVYDGLTSTAWDRTVNFDTVAAPGRTGTFEVAVPGVLFTSTGFFGVHDTSNVLNLRLGGAGDLTLSGPGGVRTNGTAVCNLEKFGNGTLTLAGSGNTFNGPLTINGGTVRVSGAGSLQTATSVTIADGTTLDYTSTVAFDRPITVQSGGTFRHAGPGALSVAPTLSDGAVFILDGPFTASSLVIPSGARVIVRNTASLPAGLVISNQGTLDMSTWTGTLRPTVTGSGIFYDRDFFKVSSFTFDGSHVSLRIHGLFGHAYQLQSSTSLASSSWQNIGTPIHGADAEITFTHPASVSPSFFRVSATP